MKKWYKYVLCMVFSVFMLLTVGCSIGKEANVAMENQGKDLLIYYVKDHPYYGTALGAFIYANPDYNITLKDFETDEEMCNLLKTEIAAGKGPDVVLMTSESEFDFYKSIKSGNLADMKMYFEQDEKYSETDYYTKVLDGAELLDGQYGVPFTFSLETLIVNRTALGEAGVVVNDSVEQFDDILALCESAIEVADNETLAFMVEMRNTLLNVTPRIQTDLVGRYVENSGIELIDAEGKLICDVEQLQKVMEFLSHVQEEYKNKEEIRKQLMQENDVSKILCMSFNGSYVYDQLIAEYFTETEKEIFVSLPWKNVDGKVQPIVCDYGVVNQNSKSKGAAYQLLKYLMDYEVPQAPGHPLSVCRDIVDKQLNVMQQRESVLTDMTLSKLSEDAYKESQSTLDNMATAIIYNTGYYDIAFGRLREFFNSVDQETVLIELQSELERYLRE